MTEFNNAPPGPQSASVVRALIGVPLVLFATAVAAVGIAVGSAYFGLLVAEGLSDVIGASDMVFAIAASLPPFGAIVLCLRRLVARFAVCGLLERVALASMIAYNSMAILWFGYCALSTTPWSS